MLMFDSERTLRKEEHAVILYKKNPWRTCEVGGLDFLHKEETAAHFL